MLSNIASIGIEIILGAISAILASVFIYIYRNSIISRLRRTLHYIFDTTAEIRITRVDKYSNKAQRQIDHQLFKKIQDEVENLSLKGVSENHLRVEIDGLATALIITIEADPQAKYRSNQGKQSGRENQKVIIKTDPVMRFGYRSYDDLEEFRKTSEEISDIISSYCFDGERPSESFVLGELETRVPAKTDDINDEELGLRAEIKDSKMIFNFNEPGNLTRGVRRYFQPLNSYN